MNEGATPRDKVNAKALVLNREHASKAYKEAKEVVELTLHNARKSPIFGPAFVVASTLALAKWSDK